MAALGEKPAFGELWANVYSGIQSTQPRVVSLSAEL